MQPQEHHEHRQRDAASLFLLGGFFLVMGALVGIGSFWAEERAHAVIINIIAAVVLLVVGGCMVAIGSYYKSKAVSADDDSSTSSTPGDAS